MVAVLLVAGVTGCATCERPAGRAFKHPEDGFAFANEMMWTYAFAADGTTRMEEVEPKPEHPHRCFPMVRAAREFFYHARFEPGAPEAREAEYRELVRRVIGRNSRCPSAEEEKITIPGYRDLHAFSAAHAKLIREECGGSWRSYLQRGNWRMIFPVGDRRERKTGRELLREVREGRLPIIHIYRFPEVRLNHAILIYGAEERVGGVDFLAYDPNNPGRPAKLSFEVEGSAFHFERNQYFGGGPVKAYEVYRGWFY